MGRGVNAVMWDGVWRWLACLIYPLLPSKRLFRTGYRNDTNKKLRFSDEDAVNSRRHSSKHGDGQASTSRHGLGHLEPTASSLPAVILQLELSVLNEFSISGVPTYDRAR